LQIVTKVTLSQIYILFLLKIFVATTVRAVNKIGYISGE
jgi:hypothetical protein